MPAYYRKTVDLPRHKVVLSLLTVTLIYLAFLQLKVLADGVRAQSTFISPLSPSHVNEYTRVVEVEKPVITPIGCDTERCKILAYLVETFKDDAANAITLIRKCENSTFNQALSHVNNNGTTDYGVMQINSIHIPKCGEAIKTDWQANIDCGYRIYQAAGNSFSPWACSHVIGTKSFWQ